MSATIEEHLDVVAARRGAEMIAAVLAKQPTGIAVMASHGHGGVLR